jgi:hypothetical protein
MSSYAELCRVMPSYARVMSSYAELCRVMQSYAELCRVMQSYAEEFGLSRIEIAFVIKKFCKENRFFGGVKNGG